MLKEKDLSQDQLSENTVDLLLVYLYLVFKLSVAFQYSQQFWQYNTGWYELWYWVDIHCMYSVSLAVDIGGELNLRDT